MHRTPTHCRLTKPQPRRARTATRSIVAEPETAPMPIFTIRLVEQTTKQGSADFRVQAATTADAACLVANAHDRSLESGNGLVTLPDGQTEFIEAETVIARSRSLLLLDDQGREISEIPILEAPSRPQ